MMKRETNKNFRKEVNQAIELINCFIIEDITSFMFLLNSIRKELNLTDSECGFLIVYYKI